MQCMFAPSLFIVSIHSSYSSESNTIPPPILEIGDTILDQHGPQRNASVHLALALLALAIDAGVAKVTDGAGVDAPLLPLELGDELHGADLGGARDGAGGEDGAEGVEAGLAGPQDARDLGDEVLDVAEALDHHEAVDAGLERVAHARDVVAGQVDQHDVLGAVLEARRQLVGQPLVLLGRGAPLDCAGDGVRDDAAALALDQQLRAGADDLEVGAVDVEQVRRRVDGPQVPVDVERVKVRGAGEALRRHGLDDVALDDVLLERRDVSLVPRLSDVGCVLLPQPDGLLLRKRDLGPVEKLRQLPDGCEGAVVLGIYFLCGPFGSFKNAIGDMQIGDDLDDAVEAIKHHSRVEKHKDGLGDAQDILHGPSRLGLKVTHAVVAHVADSTTGKGRQLQAGNVGGDDMAGQLLLEGGQGVAGATSEAGPGADDLARARSDKAVAAHTLGCCALKQERQLVLGARAIGLGTVVRRDLEVGGRRRDEIRRDLTIHRDEVWSLGGVLLCGL
ncbi:uncharacterized protein PgNI_09741 [Pyricularia grisea]|uniref:Uncharacterized protein n=1 Tax=Pyricularia grisea TaxID=148305 RepID=A0A6P8ASU1_PYRGI|nr:uncharacterized protein PgNI_09741 [Pyricularia grisea]TLD05191.1 hypothetical protein PgNI_09741 [Pyricularia grisea]